MPTSDPQALSFILNKILCLKPKSILDIGVGFGKMGVLCREYSELWYNKTYNKKEWKTRIDGIEIFYGYKNPIYDYVYNNVFFGNVMDYLDKLKEYDLILLIDVLEHLNEENGRKFLLELKKSGAHYIISTPNGFYKQGKVFGNPNEEHISDWSKHEFPNTEIIGTQLIVWD